MRGAALVVSLSGLLTGSALAQEPAAAAPAVPASAPMGAGTPARLIPDSCPSPAYPIASARAGDSGTTLIEAVVDPDGQAKKLFVAQSSGFKRLDLAARDAVWNCKFTPARDANGRAYRDNAWVRQTWRLEDAAPDPWVPLRAAAAKKPWPLTPNLDAVPFTSPSQATPDQRGKMLRRLSEVAIDQSGCHSVESVAAGPLPAAWKAISATGAPVAQEGSVVKEQWQVVECGITLDYLVRMQFPPGQPASFFMMPYVASGVSVPVRVKPSL